MYRIIAARPDGSRVSVGTCESAGQLLTVAGFDGAVPCAPYAAVCAATPTFLGQPLGEPWPH